MTAHAAGASKAFFFGIQNRFFLGQQKEMVLGPPPSETPAIIAGSRAGAEAGPYTLEANGRPRFFPGSRADTQVGPYEIFAKLYRAAAHMAAL